MDIGYDVFFFDIQNPEGILAGEKPVVAEVGPYAFNEYYQKFDIEWSDDGNIVTHNTYKYYVFDKDRTRPGLSLDDKLTLPYVSVLAFQTILEGIPVEATEFLEHAVFVSYQLSSA